VTSSRKAGIINWLLAVGTLLATLGLAEVFVRSLSVVDEDGNVSFGSVRLRPLRPPVHRVARILAQTDKVSCRGYDPDLGWAPRPNGRCQDGMSAYDAVGARCSITRGKESTQASPSLRIALYGDSFTHGDGVPFEQSWSYRLEEGLGNGGIPSEVLNFGVGGYGIDQALLRWRKTKHGLHASLVLMGFQVEDVQRNVNLLRPLFYWKTGIPFSKPRFFLRDGELALLNVPTLPPSEVLSTLGRLPSWEMRRFEHFYDEADYAGTPSRLRLWGVLEAGLLARKRRAAEPLSFYAPESEAGALTLRILEEFHDEVEADGAEFWIVLLPRREDLRAWMSTGTVPYADLLDRMRSLHVLLDPITSLCETRACPSFDDLFLSPSNTHYAGEGHQRVAEAITARIRSWHEKTGSGESNSESAD
jgi:lysophospholipase L1-like esterase